MTGRVPHLRREIRVVTGGRAEDLVDDPSTDVFELVDLLGAAY